MANIYVRGAKLYVDFFDAAGKRRQRSTGLSVGEEEQAQEVLRLIQEQVAREREGGEKRKSGHTRALTVGKYFARWQAGRKHVRTAGDESSRLRVHAMPHLEHIELRELAPKDIRVCVKTLREKELAPRTQLHVYQTLKSMLSEAVREERITANPCNLQKHELLQKRDKDLSWRAKVVFTREEIGMLISDEWIPLIRRIFHATLFFTGARFGEVAALSWADLVPREPLPMLHIYKSFQT